MAGGVRVLQPANQGHDATPEIDTVRVTVEGEVRERERVVIAPAQGLAVRNVALSVPGGTQADVVKLVVPLHFRLLGFQATGEGDGRFTLKVGDAVVAADRIHALGRSCSVTFPSGLSLSAGTTVTLAVINQTPGTRTYEGTVFGEVTSGG